MTPRSIEILTLAAAAMAMAGCDVERSQRPAQFEHMTRTFEMDKSEMARVQVHMKIGELTVSGGSANLLDGDFTYTGPGWKPAFHSQASGFRTQIEITQPGSGQMMGDHKEVWKLHLNNEKPLSLDVNCGAGEARLDLGAVPLRSLSVQMGAGQLRLDLRGQPKSGYQVTVHGGVGQADLYLPKDVAVIAEAHGGIGSINTRGMHKSGGRYVNDAYEKKYDVLIRLDVAGGVGEINLFSE